MLSSNTSNFKQLLVKISGHKYKNAEKLEQQGLQNKNLVTGRAWLTQGRRSRRV